ncbi:MAG: asparagine--tRNA ligase [bacterium]
MQFTTVSRLSEHLNETVMIKGWLYSRRSKGKLHFLLIRDGTGIVQGVMFQGDVSEDLFSRCNHLPQESSLIVTGKVHRDKRAPGGYELALNNVEIVQLADSYPLGKKSHGPDFLLKNRHLWLRSRKQWANLKIRNEVIKAVREFFDSRDFTLVDAPILTASSCEGTSTLFEVDYFGDKAYLSQSGQLYMEAAAMAFGKVYCFGPTFRAEKSKTRRHLTEFWMVEPEVAYAHLDDIMNLAEQLVTHIVQKVLEKRKMDLEVLGRDTTTLEKINPPFPRISYTEAVEILKRSGTDFEWGDDFGAPHETVISSNFDKPILIHRFPAQTKAFYMKKDPEDQRLALSVDMLASEGYGEIVGGGQRDENLLHLERSISDHSLSREVFEWYLDLRRYGSVPHAGFGLGIERTVAWLCGTPHVREVIPFPRTLYRIYP